MGLFGFLFSMRKHKTANRLLKTKGFSRTHNVHMVFRNTGKTHAMARGTRFDGLCMASQPSSELAGEQASEPLPRVNAQGKRNRTALQRLGELQRAFQRQVRRKLNEREKTALDRAALMSLRAEIAARDPKATSEDIVRLDNAASRARAAFERICGIDHKAKQGRSMADIEKELARHV